MTPEEYNIIVNQVARLATDIIDGEIRELNLNGIGNYLLRSRIINVITATHFNMSIAYIDESTSNAEKQEIKEIK